MSKPDHHVRKELCLTRAPYREGRKPTAVKVYTVNQESKYLLVQGVPTVGAKAELVKLFSSYGDIQEVRSLDDYPSDSFTEVYLISYKRIQSARIAKKRLDDWSFYGGVLHVCYAPEYESVQDTREKLQDRRKTIATKIKQYKRDGTYNIGSSNTNSSQHSTATSTGQPDNPQSIHPSHEQSTELLNRPSHMKLVQPDFQGQRTCYDNIGITSNHFTHQQNAIQSDTAVQHQDREIRDPRFRPPYQNTPSEMNPRRNFEYNVNHHDDSFSQQQQNLIQLPPPPTHSNWKNNHQHSRHPKYDFARVPSAQSGFPQNFDGRLNKPDPDIQKISTEANSEVDISDIEVEPDPAQSDEIVEHSSVDKDKTIQEKIDEHLKKDNVVIKKITQKGPAPKFIPRQMKNKIKFSQTAIKNHDSVTMETNKKINNDEISKELRRNAFTLREKQGPEDINAVENKGPELQIASVEQSVKEIRKRVSQFSDRGTSGSSTKRKKILGDE